jgi:hypothetical protein
VHKVLKGDKEHKVTKALKVVKVHKVSQEMSVLKVPQEHKVIRVVLDQQVQQEQHQVRLDPKVLKVHRGLKERMTEIQVQQVLKELKEVRVP